MLSASKMTALLLPLFGVMALPAAAQTVIAANVSAAASVGSGDSSGGGALTGSLSTPTGTQNLTTIGTADWAHWGLNFSTSFDHKASGGSQISNFTVVNGQAGEVASYGGNQIGYTWTDGSPDAAVTNTATGVYISGANRGFQITVPATTTASTLMLYVGVYAGNGMLDAHLSDGSAPDYVDTSLSASGSVPGLYTLQYQAASTGQTLTVTWTLNGSGGNVNLQSAALSVVTAPGFTVGVQPSSQTVVAGNSATYSVTITPQNGFTGTVNLGVSGFPTGATAAFTPMAITGGSGTSSLNISVPASTAFASYPLTITATSGTISNTTNANLVVTGPPDFTLGIQPSTQTVVQGNSTSYTVTVASLNGFSGTVSLALTGQPSNATVSFTPSAITGGAGSSTLGITVTSTTPVNTYQLTITATSGALSHAMGVTLNVTAAPPPDFTLTLQPSSQTVTAGNSTTFTVTVAPVSGFSGTVSLGLAGQPAGATVTFNPTSIAGGSGSSALSVTVAANTTASTYTLTVTGTSNTLSHSANSSLVVNAATGAGLIGAFSTPVVTQNLTTLGTSDWAHWGLVSSTSFDHKSAVTQQISNFAIINGQAGNVANFNGNPIGFTWTDGTPDGAVTDTTTGVYINTTGRGFQITAPADTSVRTLTVFLGVFASQGQFLAHLSDGSSPNYVDTSLSNSGSQSGAYTLQYAAGSAGQTLTVTWTLNSGVGANGALGNINLTSAALSPGGNLTPNFTETVQPGTQSAAPGGSANYTVSISPLNGFTGTVGLGVTGLPAGATPVFTPSSISGGSGTSTLSISIPANATANSYTLTITGTSGTLTQSATATLQVTGPPDYTVGIQPSSQNVAPGNSTSYVVTVTPLNGFNGGVSLLTSGLPTGVTATFNPGSITGGSGTTNLTIAVPSGIAPNNYPFTVNATSGMLSHSAGATLSVVAGGGGPLLAGSIFAPAGNQDLTTLGTSDWADWGLATATDFNHKAGVTQQISNFTTVNAPADAVGQTVDVVPNFTWTDGTPTQSTPPTGTAVDLDYATALNTGFQFTVPADTTTRLLSAYVCVTNAQGSMTAHLSDGSAPDYVDTSVTNGSLLCMTYTFVYRANSANQTLTLTWVMYQTLGINSAIYLEAATLSVVSPSAGFSLSGNPASQQILPGNTAAWNLDLSPGAGFGATATFTVTGLPTGATAAFSPADVVGSGMSTVTVSTTTATPAGSYTVNFIASAPGASESLPVTLTILNTTEPYLGAAISTPSVSIPINLTSVGTSDWAHWGLNFSSDFDDKASGGQQISNISIVNGELGQVGEESGPLSFSWSDGTPDASATATLTGVYIKGLNVGFQITAPADTTPRTLIVYVGVFNTQGLLTAHLSDSSSPDYMDTSLASSGFIPGAYQISYKASLPSQNITITFTMNTNTGPRCSEIYGVHCTVSLQSAALVLH